MNPLAQFIVDVPDFPKPGILFRDITPLLRSHFREAVEALDDLWSEREWSEADAVAGVESRGFILAAALAERRGMGFVPVRKKGKLPAKHISVEYSLEYGKSQLDIHEDALKRGQKALIVDDLLATGGTANAAAKLVELLGAKVHAIAFVVELEFLKGRDRLRDYDVLSLVTYK